MHIPLKVVSPREAVVTNQQTRQVGQITILRRLPRQHAIQVVSIACLQGMALVEGIRGLWFRHGLSGASDSLMQLPD